MNPGRVRPSVVTDAPDDVTLPLPQLPEDMATRLDGAWNRPPLRRSLAHLSRSRSVRLAALALGIFTPSFAFTRLATRSARVAELPRTSGISVPGPVVLVEPRSELNGDAGDAATLLVAGNWIDAEIAYGELARLHPECPVFAVVARVLAARRIGAMVRGLP